MPEFAKDGKNCFLVKPAADKLSVEKKDKLEGESLMDVLESRIAYLLSGAGTMAGHRKKAPKMWCRHSTRTGWSGNTTGNYTVA